MDEAVTNINFWKELITEHKEVNVIIDEGHILFNSRNSMSKDSRIVLEWVALLRRVLGGNDNNNDLTIISQLSRRLDVVLRDMANEVKYTICHYIKTCKKCSYSWQECNETAEKFNRCLNCNNIHITKHKTIIEVYHFSSVEDFNSFKNFGYKTAFKHYLINDIETIFGNYDTLQFDDLLSDTDD